MDKAQRRFHIKDVSKWVVGSMLLASPVAMTSDVWNLGEELSTLSIILIAVVSLGFIAWFGYHTHY